VSSSTWTLSTSGGKVYDVICPPCTSAPSTSASDSYAFASPVLATVASNGNSCRVGVRVRVNVGVRVRVRVASNGNSCAPIEAGGAALLRSYLLLTTYH
jgi:hypothetical protein